MDQLIYIYIYIGLDMATYKFNSCATYILNIFIYRYTVCGNSDESCPSWHKEYERRVCIDSQVNQRNIYFTVCTVNLLKAIIHFRNLPNK